MIGLLTAVMLAAAPESPQVEPPTPPPLPQPEPDVAPVPRNDPPDVPPEPAATAHDASQLNDSDLPGGQFGAVGLLGAAVDIGVRTRATDPLGPPSRGAELDAFGGIAGIGLRYGFFQREMHRQWMPSVAGVVGMGVSTQGFTPFLEGRMEMISVSEGGPLQPNFTLYGLTGLGLNPIGGTSTRGFGVRPHVGFGLGWNWLPRGGGGDAAWGGNWFGGSWGGGGGGLAALVAIPVAVGIVAMIFAGRLEVRYTARPLMGAGNDFVSVVFGVGG